jgi:hypothetical protein
MGSEVVSLLVSRPPESPHPPLLVFSSGPLFQAGDRSRGDESTWNRMLPLRPDHVMMFAFGAG